MLLASSIGHSRTHRLHPTHKSFFESIIVFIYPSAPKSGSCLLLRSSIVLLRSYILSYYMYKYQHKERYIVVVFTLFVQCQLLYICIICCHIIQIILCTIFCILSLTSTSICCRIKRSVLKMNMIAQQINIYGGYANEVLGQKRSSRSKRGAG